MNIDNIKKIILNDPIRRKYLCTQSHELFLATYFSHYLKYPVAPFQKKILEMTENLTNKLTVISAFRGSAKSTIISLSFVIWSIIGNHQKKYILVIGRTQSQARQHLLNIKRELESNELLKGDFGHFRIEDPWNADQLLLPKYNAKIVAVSYGQDIRGTRHGQNRPDLVILDDIEESTSIGEKDARDKVMDWLNSEIFPIGDVNTNFFIVGNMLHRDSMMMRLTKKIENKELEGEILMVPIIDKFNNIAWPGKFKSMADIEALKKTITEYRIWSQEYLLAPMEKDDVLVLPEHIHYYDELPEENAKNNYRGTFIGVDLAISEKKSAHDTGIVIMKLFGYGDNVRAYITKSINRRMNFVTTVALLEELCKKSDANKLSIIYVESVAYQKSVVDFLLSKSLPVEGVPATMDKRSRLAVLTPAIQNGIFLYPKTGVETLILQLIGFGIEKDDLVDAHNIVGNKIMLMDHKRRIIGMITTDGVHTSVTTIDSEGKIIQKNSSISNCGVPTNRTEKFEYYRRLEELNNKGIFVL